MDKFTLYTGLCVVFAVAALSVWRANAAVAAVNELDSSQVRESVLIRESYKSFAAKLDAMDAKLDAQLDGQLQHNQDTRERLIRLETTIEQIELRLRDRLRGPATY